MVTTRLSPFGLLLQRARRAAGLTQEELAERAGVSARAISDLERGCRSRPRSSTLALLAEALHLSPEDRARLEAVSRAPAAILPAAPTATPSSNLPAFLTPLIGRERDEAVVVHLLSQPEVRLVTLTGPPGIGKTRLAVQVAAGLEDDTYPDGARFIELASARDPSLVLPTIAQVIGLRDDGSQPFIEALCSFLRDKRLLLVMDNFEQVVVAAPDVTALLTACPGLRVLVTSRSPLHVRGEYELSVPPLVVPAAVDTSAPPLDDLSQYSAITLFVQRARAVKPTFALTPANARAVSEICRRLDGLPLAIELAAAWVKILPPEALLRRLDHRLSVLTGGPQDLPERQRTLERAIDWSYDLLDSGERSLFRRLAVFSDGWTLEALETISGASSASENKPYGNVMASLFSLVDKSLVQADEHADGEPRFRLLETIREYAVGRLEAQGEAQAWRRHHAAYYLAFAEAAEPNLAESKPESWLASLGEEQGNLRAALLWARANREVELGLRLACAVCPFWRLRGHYRVGLDWIEEMLALGDRPQARGVTDALRAKALQGAASLLEPLGAAERAIAFLEESLALRRQLGDAGAVAETLIRLGDVIGNQGDNCRATALLEEALVVSREAGDRRRTADALDQLALLVRNRGDYERAVAMFEEALSLRREMGDRRGIALGLFYLARMASTVQHDDARAVAWYGEALAHFRDLEDAQASASVLMNLGEIALRIGEPSRAMDLFQHSLALFHKMGVTTGIAAALMNMGSIARAQGDGARARELLAEGLRLAWEAHSPRKIAEALEGLAEVACLEGRADYGTRLYGRAAALREATTMPVLPADRQEYERALNAIRSELGAAVFTLAWEAGSAMPLEQVIQKALGRES
jgi:predicted ATPase/DNA-binding XRE family transcriptional regulator/Tfp pilus assembly protein PilF